MSSQECSVCGEEKHLGDFPKNGTYKDGSVRYRPDCKQCYAITRKLTKKKAITKFLNNTKHRTGEEDTYTLDDWRDVLLYFRGGCAYCGKKQSRKLRLTRDHLIPVATGGLTVRANILPACRSCNSSKSDYEWKEWIAKRKYYNPEQVKMIEQWVREC